MNEVNPQAQSSTQTLSIAGWEIHTSRNLITKGEKSARLEPRTMAVLICLAESPGEVVTRQQLEDTVWLGTVVGYEALSNAITKLRKSFGDDRKNPRVIETIPKVGYRLIAEVDRADAVGESSLDIERPQRKTRKLAAILYADVAGYSRLTEANEEETHDILSDYLDAISRAIEHHNGNVVHYAGDAVLAEFATVVDALSCSVEVQRNLAERNANQPADALVQFRMGINLGDVIVDRDDIYGEGVNVAARLESLADPGGICISESVRGAIGKKLPLSYDFMGEQLVKNIAEPVRAYRVILAPESRPAKLEGHPRILVVGTVAFFVLLTLVVSIIEFKPWQVLEQSAPTSLSVPDKPSIAVLPFTNMSDDLAQEHFADGFTDDLITDLSQISGLFVIARHSVFSYKDQPITPRQVAQDLGVRYLLAGSIRKNAGQIRINTQLIDAQSGGQLWAERYSVESAAIFGVQDNVIESIVAALAVELTDVEQRQLERAPTTNLEAYDYYLRAERRRFSDDVEFSEILRLYQRALELDPDFVAARASLARVAFDIWQVDGSQAIPPTVARKLAYDSASAVLALEPDIPDAFAVLARLQVTQGEPEIAEESARKAVALNPNKAIIYLDLGIVLSIAGKHSEALEEMETALRLDPKPKLDFYGEYGRVLFFDGQYERAIEQLEKSRGLGFIFYDTVLAGSYAELGRIDEAESVLSGPFRWQKFGNLAYYRTLWSHYREKDLDHIIRALAKAGATAWPYGYQPAVQTRLRTGELEALTVDQIWVGSNFSGENFVRQFTSDGRVAMRDQASLLSGTVQIRDDLLCIQFPSTLLERDDCGYVYRHAGGTPQERNEYVHVTIGEVYFFSVSP